MKRFLLCTITIAVAACSDSPVVPATLSVAVSGRAERGSTIHVAIKRGADTTLITATGVTASPADAATVLANGDVQLLKTGALTLTASTATGNATTVVNVALPPTIFFDGQAAGNRDIYRIALDGGELTRLTTHAADDVHPTATGTSLVFNSFRDGNSEIYTTSTTGGTERRLTTTTSNETHPSLSPDGRRIAFSSNISGITKVWLGSIDFAAGTALTGAAKLTAATFGSSGTVEATAAWAPASDRLVLMTTNTPSGGAGLFISPATAGASPTLITGSGTQVVEVEPVWSFDAARIAYASATGGVTEIYVRDAVSGASIKLTSLGGSNGQPAWLADGRIVFTSFSGGAATLRWIDPAAPTVVHTIATPGLSAEHSAPLRP